MENDRKYKEEVFHIYGTFTYPQAVAIASKLKCKLASWNQMMVAHQNGANWCDYGWSLNQEAYYPIQQNYHDLLKKRGAAKNCGKPGVNGGYFRDRKLKFGINCYGLRPNLFSASHFRRNSNDFKQELLELGLSLEEIEEVIEDIEELTENNDAFEEFFEEIIEDIQYLPETSSGYNNNVFIYTNNVNNANNYEYEYETNEYVSESGSPDEDNLLESQFATLSGSPESGSPESGSPESSLTLDSTWTKICEDSDACNTSDEGSCTYPESNRVDCDGKNLYCEDSQACNYDTLGDCSYPASDRVDCDGKNLYCEAESACNYDKLGDCSYPESNRVDCDGKNLYCEAESACNYDKFGDCSYPESNRVDCDGKNLYCEAESACNYDKFGDCSYAPVGYTCAGSEIKSNEDKKSDSFDNLLGLLLSLEGFQNRIQEKYINNKNIVEHFSTYTPDIIEGEYEISKDEFDIVYNKNDKEYNDILIAFFYKFFLGRLIDSFSSYTFASTGVWKQGEAVPPESPPWIKVDIDEIRETIESPVAKIKDVFNSNIEALSEFLSDDDMNTLLDKIMSFWNSNLEEYYELSYVYDTTIKELSYTLTEPEVEIKYCEAESACNTGSEGSCRYPASDRIDCNGNNLYCEAESACNTGSEGSCRYPESDRVDCYGNNLYCEAESACNTGSEGSCRYPTSDRVDCNGNTLYCEDPEACNYNEMGECSYHGSRVDCEDNPLYCTDPEACNYNEMGDCSYHGSRKDCAGNALYCTDSKACNFNGENGSCQYPDAGFTCEGILKPLSLSLNTSYPIFILNRNKDGKYILEDKDGDAVSNETLQSYTLKSNQTTNNGYELILYMVIPLNFKGVFYIVDGQGNDYNTNISNDFVCIGQNNELTIESTTMTYEEIDTDNSGSSIPSHYKLYKINLFNQYENYLIGTKDIEEGFTNLTGSQLFNNDTKLNKLLEIKTNCGSRYDCKGNTLFCADPIACNYNEVGSCTYHGSREDCEENALYCDEFGACNRKEMGSCRFAEENHSCGGAWIGEFCPPNTENACNPGEKETCWFPGQKDDRSADPDPRVDCDSNPKYCTDPEACNYDGENGSCIYHGSRKDCDGKALYCADPEACNYNKMGDCSYHGSRKDCDGKALYCADPEACNYNEMGDCSYHGSRKDCDGKALYCADPEACNYNEMGDCSYHGSREDCEGNPLYCADPEACNYNEMGDCSYHGSRKDCEGNPLYCTDSDALNYDEYGSCRFAVTFDNDTLKTAVEEWIYDSTSAEFKYGHISDWDVSQVTSMSELFKDADNFNEIIDNWVVSNVIDMSYMFSGASSYNQSIYKWNVSKVTDMSYMFENASEFNRSLKNWDVSSVENMEKMFTGASSFNSNITGWDVSGVTNMLGMFNGATSFNQDISGWDVSSVEVMQGMFYNATAFNKDISGWDISSVTNMTSMFGGATKFNKDISGWDISSVTNMTSMFGGATAFNSGYGNGFSITPSSLFWKINRCDNSQACNYMSTTEGSCYYEGRTDCDGNVLYCADPMACNYDEMGDCSYHGSRIDCKGNKIYCDDDDACNTGSMNDCQYPPDGLDCEGNCDNPSAINYGNPGSCYSDVDTLDKFFEKYTNNGDSYVNISTDGNRIKTYQLKNDKFEFNSDNIDDWLLVNEIESDVVFDGNKKTITIDIGTDNWTGLFKPKDISDGTFKIWNLTLEFSSNIANNDGGFISDSDSITGYTVNIWNCKSQTNNSSKIRDYGGGIVGRAFNKGTLQYCYNNLGINVAAGGICGANSGQSDDGITIKYCYCEAPIVAGSSGGIAGQNLKNAEILYCYYINPEEDGLNKNNFGGIAGKQAGNAGNVEIKHCYSKFVGKNNNSQDSGGICGSNSASSSGSLTIYNCYHEGSLNDDNCGGICGSSTNSGTTIINCYYSKGGTDLTNTDSIIGSGTNATVEDCLISKSWNDDMAYATIGKNTDDSGNTIINGGLSWYVPGGVAWIITDSSTGISNGSFTDGSTNLTASRAVDSIIDYFGEDVDVTYETIDSITYTVYTLNTEKEITENTGLSIENNVIFDGNNKTITYSGSDAWEGLFRPASGVDSSNKITFQIRNINFVLNGANVAEKDGCILGTSNDGTTAYDYFIVDIENCHTSGTGVIGNYAGGICGGSFGRSNSGGSITNCSNSLAIGGSGMVEAGGICGFWNQVAITYCWNTGSINGIGSGGICGSNVTSSCEIKYCYNKGVIKTKNSGGICGKDAHNATIFNCYSDADGTANVNYQGGIMGANTAKTANKAVNIYNCWVKGDDLTDGFVGSESANGTLNVINCYYIGSSDMIYDDNTYKTREWDDTYAYYTIGQSTGTEPGYTDVRWNNDNTKLWMIHNDGNGSLGGSFRNEYELSSTANADKSTKATMGELLFIFGDAIGESGGTYTLKDNVKITEDMTGYFPIPIEDGMTFDGGDNTITYEGTTEWEGLFKAVANGSFTVQNVTFDLYGSDLASRAGCITSENHDGTNFLIENCSWNIDNCHSVSSNSKEINNSGAGICGRGIGYNVGEVTVTNCSNALNSTYWNAAGIVAMDGGVNSTTTNSGSSLVISGCTNTGNFTSGSHRGGICGRYCFNKNSNTNNEIFNCHNTGIISGQYNGGICASNVAQNGGKVVISYCSNTTSTTKMGSHAGGMCGYAAGNSSGIVEIKYCFNSQPIGTSGGGICGSQCVGITIFNCYNTGNGDSNDDNQGGIGGKNSSGLKVYNCWSSGSNLTDAFIGSQYSTCTVKNCYNISDSTPMSDTYTNTYSTDSWDDTYAYYTIGRNAYLDGSGNAIADIRWYNDRNDSTDEWLIGITAYGETTESGFDAEVTLGTANQGDATTWNDLKVLFGSAFEITDSGTTCTLTRSITIDDSVNTGTFPIDMPVDGGSTYTFDGGYDSTDASPITITIDSSYGENWSGLFKPVADAILNIQNVNIEINKTLGNNHGVLVGNGYDANATDYSVAIGNATIDNCHVSTTGSTTIGSNGGGLFGQRYGYSATIAISNCTNSLGISGENAGGICGVLAGYTGTLTIESCSNSGDITGDSAGGICGKQVGKGGTLTVGSCSNSGDITGTSAGGICGNQTGQDGTLTITYCSNSGEISGGESGGICGNQVVVNGISLSTINYCSNSGEISGGESGGICGSQTGQSGILDIDNCSNSGEISGTSAGGICGSRAGKSAELNITYCSNSGEISGTSAGGICGEAVAYNGATVTISYCENTGDINPDNGGICGPYTSHLGGGLTIDSCNNTGVVNLGGGGICGAYCCGGGICSTDIDSDVRNSGDVTITNCTNSGEIKADDSDDGTGAGGIVGRYAARGYDGTNTWTLKTLIIESCSNSGQITGTSSNFSGGGGICGSYAFYSNELTTNKIKYCSNTGVINGRGGGGICGSYCCNTGNANIGKATISYCYSTGELTNDRSGGIVGAYCGGKMKVKYCYYNYTTNNITNNYLGGIVGEGCGIVIFNCYSIFNRDGSTNSGGIAGKDFDGSIYNCYHKGDITNPISTGAILGNYDASLNPVIKNTYYIYSDGSENNFIGGDNNTKISNDTNILTNCYQTNGWDDTYAYYTIGQGTETNYTDVRWNNDNTTLWLIHNNGNSNLGGSFGNDYDLGSNNDGDHVASMSDLLVIFSGKIEIDSSNSNKYNLTAHVTISEREKAYFPIPIEDGMTFDGGGNTITYEGDTAWTGLFKVNNSGDFTLQNTQFNLASGGLTSLYGCFFQSSQRDMGGHTINVINCSSVTSNPYTSSNTSGMFIPNNAGGIFGDDCADNGTVNLTYCYNEIPIKPTGTGNGAGGLTGSSPTLDSGTLIIKYCYNSGDILSNNCGGLIGHNQQSGTVIIFNCYNTGNGNSSSNQGGLIGANAAGTVNIYNCWSSGRNLTDGFVGSTSVDVTVENCYNISDSTPMSDTYTNTYSTETWDDTYAYYTIGQGTETNYTDVRWNNDNTTLWMIHNDGNAVEGSFAGSYTLGANNDGGHVASLSDLLVIFSGKITFANDTYTLSGDIEISEREKAYFPIPIEDGMTFDGGGNTITYEGTSEWGGLFYVVSGTDSNNKMTFTVQNINFVLNGADIADYCGGIIKGMGVQDDGTYANNTFTEYTDITILNCHISSENSKAIGSKAGGIVGLGFCNGTGEVGTITNCSNTLTISGNAGGICGRIAANTTLTYCWNEGSISSDSGGICGQAVGKFGIVKINYCYNKGALNGTDSGGICGRYSSGVNIFNCYNTGNGDDSTGQGGIVGGNAGSNNGTTNIYNCWVKGDNLADGFVGSVSGTVNVKNCYYIGTSNMIYTDNTYKTDNWDDTYAYYTIGQSTGTDGFTDIRWNNDNTALWMIHNDGNGNLEGSFGNDYDLGSNNDGDHVASMSDLLVIFSGKITFANDTYTLNTNTNIEISEREKAYFPIPIEDGMTFDGGDNTITYEGTTEWEGLFKAVANGSFTVQNVTFDLYGSDLASRAGCITSENHDGTNFLIENCSWTIDNCHSESSNSKIINSGGGAGICGRGIGYNGGEVTVTNCSNALNSTYWNAVGIVAMDGGVNSTTTNSGSSLVISGCTNTGNFTSGSHSGGICGRYCFNKNSNTNNEIFNCHNTGIISGQYNGGICASNVAQNGGKVVISYCSNTTSTTKMGSNAGGMCGYAAGNSSGIVEIKYCFNSQPIGSNGGGICGSNCTGITIFNCYNTGNGDSNDANQGGIGGKNSNGLKVYNCWSSGSNLTDAFIGSVYSTTCIVKNCYSVGTSNTIYTDNTYKTENWDDTYAYYTIGKGTEPNYTNVRWNNDSVTEWLISDGGNTVGGSFAGSYTLGTANQGDATTWNDLKVLFGSAFKITDSGTTCTLTRSITIDDSVNTGTFPIDMPVDGGSTYTFDGDSDNDNNYTITIDSSYGENWDGLFKPVATAKLNIQNVNIIINRPFNGSAGALVKSGYKSGITDTTIPVGDATIDNCHVSTTNSIGIPNNGGGLIGARYGYGATITIQNCSNSLEVSGDNAGGICGVFMGYKATSVTILDCTNSGEISGHSAGGICGQGAGKSGTEFIIKYCSNTGEIAGEKDSNNNPRSAGGICGRDAGYGCDEFLIQYCWNEGNMTGDGTGGICGIYSGGGNGTHSIEYCYNSGNFEADNAGGICGQNARNMIIFNCYNTGNTGNVLNSVDRCGGITGNDTSSGTDTEIYNCYNAGSISNNATNCGGIIGGSYDRVIVKNCYWLGTASVNVNGAGSVNSDSSNNLSSLIWYEGYANKTINSNNGLSAKGKSSSNLKWYDSFGDDDTMRLNYGGYLQSMIFYARGDNTTVAKRNENLKITLLNYNDDAFQEIVKGNDAFSINSNKDVTWILTDDSNFTIQNYALIDIPTIKISMVDTENNGDVLNVKDVRVDYVDTSGSSDVLLTEINRASNIDEVSQKTNTNYLIENTTHSIRYTTDSTYTTNSKWRVGWLGVEYSSSKKGWHGNSNNSQCYAQIQFVNPNDTDNIITPRPWLITDENTTWGDTSFEDDQ